MAQIAMRKMARVSRTIESARRTFDRIDHIFMTDEFQTHIKRRIHPSVIAMLQNALRRSGVKNRTGRLAMAVRNSKIRVELDKGRIFVEFPPGLPDKFYMIASSINYGSVRGGGSVFGKTFKKSLKKSKTQYNSGGITIVPPIVYYRLSAADKQKIQAMVSMATDQYLKKKLSSIGAYRRTG